MKEEVKVYEKVHRAMVTEEVTEKRGGLAFGLTFFSLPCIQYIQIVFKMYLMMVEIMK